ncbi:MULTISPECIES: GAF domain-containing protein [Gulbenkiania]|uniref:GAF domain n=2 Tax=Gulbenkiania TaxID=397456 RepID=A0A0K6H2N8_9NEIS|nr:MULTISPECIES: GAF domain-containing protein [Gulbenkiania]TCW33584.1 GAF domain-containing protein [Gulbenkiania mobilis]CUA85150.1 GAF domain [Gulbenkiania indica]
MIYPPFPADEHERIATLHALGILDTGREPSFDQVTDWASNYFQVPIALVTLVDHDRQWFKSACGLDTPETSREVSFCAHTVVDRQLMVVENALLDPRFFDNPLVTGEPFIRFYAGAPLLLNGQALGTFCLIDNRPRRLDGEERAKLTAIARLVAELIEQQAPPSYRPQQGSLRRMA